ncbi:R2-like ligand-binding oxidase [Balneolaceae bacterium YR4-1]|uniref:R2-like ligand binding oxidase n=1 Tax=Halalkalibaculum roseum TaxID=2709311 RepID=A0A6M1SVM4_9BACT|nr:R2-like ligand-binding oxidase [Halalkalibaculum roseum]NGP76176.1 R2-like ligand-binding oxidase [Halalkalibaculum roseum]
MSLEVFSESWAEHWKENLNVNSDYENAASKWEWTIMLVMKIERGNDKCLFLDLWHGKCREIRECLNGDREKADYVISGNKSEWKDIFDRKTEPMMAFIQGKLTLKKGSLLSLSGYTKAAQELLKSAISIPSYFPGENDNGQQSSGPSEKPIFKQSEEASTQVKSYAKRGRKLNRESFPMKLFEKAKTLGIWNPSEIDFKEDRKDWLQLNEIEKEVLLHLTSLFLAGEESVTEDILPLISVISNEQRLEEELYLTTFLWEEAKHTDFFNSFIEQVVQEEINYSRFHTQGYKKLFYEELPKSLNRLLHDTSAAAQINASVTYNMIVEGTLAETGYHAYHKALEQHGLMPGLRKGIGYLKKDESRHIAYGIYLLSRLVAQNPELWSALQQRMEELLDVALSVIDEIFKPYDPMPFGLNKEEFIGYALNQFKKRIDKLEIAKEDGFGPV